VHLATTRCPTCLTVWYTADVRCCHCQQCGRATPRRVWCSRVCLAEAFMAEARMFRERDLS
jgi:hypothetical protein